MIKAIFFDFDGVIVESAHIKTDAFREIFSKWPEYCEEAVKYHIINAGISRFVKFRYLYEELLKQPYTEDIEKEMGEEFSRIVFEQVMKAPLVDGTVEFFEDKDNVCQSFVVSATPQE
ncbi:MAG: hypothetical protein KJ736_10970 [Candidatus Omnitrophica bacterium]|nr:hypothetical protein [Candidatus Omnitrophota bacterium]